MDPVFIDSTLREGEQFAGAHFSFAQKQEVALLCDLFGVEYLEVGSPAASPQTLEDARRLRDLNLRLKILAHVRCLASDVERAIEARVQGVNLLFATSPVLREHSHGRSIEQIVAAIGPVVELARSHGLETRFSCEDAFRSDPADLAPVYAAAERARVDRIGIADTVGIATPREVYDRVRWLRENFAPDVEFHGHNDTGCAVANAFCAWEAGARFLDVTILGIGERNGIAPLSALVARIYASDRKAIEKYNLKLLARMDERVSRMIGLPIPFTAPITSANAFTHRAGMHTKAILAVPESYECLNPDDFGVRRMIDIAHRLTGRNALQARAEQIGLHLDDAHLLRATELVKRAADERPITIDNVDMILKAVACERAAGGEGEVSA